MIKNMLIKIIDIYQIIPGPWHGYCKHIPTCSNYAIEAIDTYGTIYGSVLPIKRILHCNPFTKAGYDPVPKRKKKERENL